MSYYRRLVRQSRLYPVLVLENLLSHQWRHRLARLVFWLLVASLILWWVYVYTGLVQAEFISRVLGALLLALACSVVVSLLNVYFHSYYLTSIVSNVYNPADLFTFTVGRILQATADNDLLKGFLLSSIGERLNARLGIDRQSVLDFLQNRRNVSPPLLPLKPGEVLRLRPLTEWLLGTEGEWANFLLKHEIREQDLLLVVEWLIREIEQAALKERWWTWENLSRIKGLGWDWAFGATYRLDHFSVDLTDSPEARPREIASFYLPLVRRLETVLLRSQEANALLVGPAGELKTNILFALAREIRAGRIAPQLEHRRLKLIKVALFLAAVKDKNGFERELVKIFDEALRAGNLILAIDNLALLKTAADNFSVNLPDLLDVFLASGRLPLIALVDSDAFHQSVGSVPALMRRFEKLQLDSLAGAELLTTAEALATEMEKRYGLTFTLGALQAVVAGVEQFYPTEEVADKIADFLIEIGPAARGQGQRLITKKWAAAFVADKTGVPAAQSGADKEKLLQLENLLAEKIVGQKPAINALASALRRGRAGVRNPKRPIGAFLFLGPTGVGKTETAKALAGVFFGSEEELRRLDMSEYRGPDALERLIGSFNLGRPGILASMLRDHPYGVVLLDEFEKAHPDVLNLFLQVFDEGFFSDMAGRRVNARNLIFIATSNAAAELIWQMVQAGKDPAGVREDIINHLVQNGLFRPELLNRFDDIVIYHPLSGEELKQVAGLLLGRLAKRLKEKGLILQITPELIGAVAVEGSSGTFGARPMQRFIQDKVEEPIARLLIAGTLKSGSGVVVNKSDSGNGLVIHSTPLAG